MAKARSFRICHLCYNERVPADQHEFYVCAECVAEQLLEVDPVAGTRIGWCRCGRPWNKGCLLLSLREEDHGEAADLSLPLIADDPGPAALIEIPAR